MTRDGVQEGIEFCLYRRWWEKKRKYLSLGTSMLAHAAAKSFQFESSLNTGKEFMAQKYW
jgi:hypothetical protein